MTMLEFSAEVSGVHFDTPKLSEFYAQMSTMSDWGNPFQPFAGTGEMGAREWGLTNVVFDSRIKEAQVYGDRRSGGETMTDQTLFDRCAEQMLHMGKRGRGPGGVPAYFDKGERRCIIAHLMCDEYVGRLGLEKFLVATAHRDHGRIALHRNVVTLSLDFDPTDMQVRFLSQLQRLHDSEPVENWPAALRTLAYGYELSAEVVGYLEPSFVVHEPKRHRAGDWASLYQMKPSAKSLKDYAEAFKAYDFKGLEKKTFDWAVLESSEMKVVKLSGFQAEFSIFDEVGMISEPDDGLLLTHGGKKQPAWTKMNAYVDGLHELQDDSESTVSGRDGIWFGEKRLELA